MILLSLKHDPFPYPSLNHIPLGCHKNQTILHGSEECVSHQRPIRGRFSRSDFYTDAASIDPPPLHNKTYMYNRGNDGVVF